MIRYAEEWPWKIQVIPQRSESLIGQGDDLFHALQDVRRQLDPRGIVLCCNGARANARPSRAASERGAEFVYLIPKGRPASTRDLAPIFSPVPADMAVTVEEQEESWRRISSRRVNSLWPINPAWWVRRYEEVVKGAVVWIPEADKDGFTTWHPHSRR
ncbi:hypothetical protein [Streptomyces sp. R08]|uniref:Uncharacterized protein n=1 Tax=Streptomyces sp. R08 TaxID=3238624 RepID=A0AB39MBY1_9ACTN